ncbi:hypothetical protein ASPWEDRAFT_170938 [Aspergillus wentii DTO 134E9]|uniref:Uncharacterized protein n=1 Tax=Aspergillus wentii DTO 134E9 TaxID=1073089 RepID=A0A1L9RRG8_ASPWE|nr:uncharacterized protein ASPWEDRAFT_170938 [Aspergillus wentii DTO 134E9]KAI9930313.1 hypothetical protein MW887_011065 [Aspergillus wentii]OJJ37463.1 hypothetical protein ASPWEDRAFT_170938 [Aspergillus wentii DTO 134E9]
MDVPQDPAGGRPATENSVKESSPITQNDTDHPQNSYMSRSSDYEAAASSQETPVDPTQSSRWTQFLLKYSDPPPEMSRGSSEPAKNTETSLVIENKYQDTRSLEICPSPILETAGNRALLPEVGCMTPVLAANALPSRRCKDHNDPGGKSKRRPKSGGNHCIYPSIWPRKSKTPLMEIAEFEAMMVKHDINFTLLRARMFLDNGHDNDAQAYVMQALEVAQRLGQEPVIARCIFWLGRIEYARGNYTDAYQHFLGARRCLGEYPEGEEDLPLYMSLFQQGLTPEVRERILLEHSKAIVAEYKKARNKHNKGEIPTRKSSRKTTKRKRSPISHDRVLRTPPSKAGKSKDPNEKKGKRNVRRPTVWLTQESEDQHIHPRDEPKKWRRQGPPSIKNIESQWEMNWLTASNKSPHRPEQSAFEFRRYPRGLATRTRLTHIFSEQPWEIIISAKEWEAMQEQKRNKRLTMGHLARERRRLGRKVLEKAKLDSKS